MDDLSLPTTQLAQAILTLASVGAPVPEVLADELARTVLSDPKVAAAQAVAEGGPHKLLRAIELAEAVLGDLAEQRKPDSVSNRCVIGRGGHRGHIDQGATDASVGPGRSCGGAK